MNDKRLKKELGQFFTPTSVADLVAEFVPGDIGSVMDLAAGYGDLLLPVKVRHNPSIISAVDIDPISIANLTQDFPAAEILEADALNLGLSNRGIFQESGFDLVVGNPPYNKQQVSEWTLGVIKAELGMDCSRHSSVRAELGFLALSLMATKDGGYLSVVLPKTIAVGESWQWLRDVLLRKHSVIAVASLPASSFRNTEVETCIVTLQKGRPTRDKIRILDCDKAGVERNGLFVASEDAGYRLDYEYHRWSLEYGRGSAETLSEAGVRVVRGNIHSKKAKDMGMNIFHTSSFNKVDKGEVCFPEFEADVSQGFVAVCKDDILIPRVGRNLTHVARVVSGQSVISDCVFGLKAPAGRLDDVYKTLDSDQAREWIKVHTSGACAKIISKGSLLNMPLLN